MKNNLFSITSVIYSEESSFPKNILAFPYNVTKDKAISFSNKFEKFKLIFEKLLLIE